MTTRRVVLDGGGSSSSGGYYYQTVDALPYEQQIGQGASATLLYAVMAATVALVGVLVFAGVVPWLNYRYSTWNAENIKTVSGVPPDPATNDVALVAGLGLVETALPLSNTVLLENGGLVTANSLSGAAGTGNIDIVGTAPAIVIASAGSTITVSSPAIVTLNSAAAVANNFVLAAGTGIGVATVAGTATFSTPAVLTINSAAAVANNFIIAGGAGITVGTAGHTATVSSSAVLTVNSAGPVAGDIVLDAGDGLAAQTTGNTVTYSDVLATATTLDDTSAAGSLVRYEVAIGFFVPVAENAGWRAGLAPGWPQSFIPGAVTGDSGLGDAAGTGWAVPAVGTYTVHADCEVTPSAIAVNDMQVVSVALALAANSEDPLAIAIVPAGGYASLDISGGTNANVAPPTVPRRISLSTTFQAGCTNCAVQVGDALSVHAQMERTGILVGPYDFNAYCNVQVATIR